MHPTAANTKTDVFSMPVKLAAVVTERAVSSTNTVLKRAEVHFVGSAEVHASNFMVAVSAVKFQFFGVNGLQLNQGHGKTESLNFLPSFSLPQQFSGFSGFVWQL